MHKMELYTPEVHKFPKNVTATSKFLVTEGRNEAISTNIRCHHTKLSNRVHGCLSIESVVCCQVQVSATS